MYNLGLSDVVKLAKDYNLIPVAKRIMADMETPIRAFQHFYEDQYAFLLESVEGGEKWARYSFIGTDPFLIVKGKDGQMIIQAQNETKKVESNPLETLKEYLRSFVSPLIPDLPPFTGGAIGFFGYDLLQYYENLPEHRVDDLLMNDIEFMFCDRLVVFDHFKQQILVLANAHIKPNATDDEIKQEYERVCNKIEETVEKLRQPIRTTEMKQHPTMEEVELGDIVSNVTKEQYIDNVDKAKEYIAAGDIFQVVLSQRFHIETDISPLKVYRVLRILNPSPYMYYLKMGSEVIVGTSPEALVRVDDNIVQTRPIAGTRARGRTNEEDLALEKELLQDKKELAEHLMLVDLGRNDIGRVAKYGTVEVDSFMEIERYSHVMHIVSNVKGELREDKDFFEAFISCLPAGTVSGAPKLRAMEIIAELENEARGAYAGAIGYLGFTGNLNTCITIRTIIFKNGKAYVQAGAGIVYDSVPEKEYEETVNKAKALLTAIRIAQSIFEDDTAGNGIRESEANQDYFYNQVNVK